MKGERHPTCGLESNQRVLVIVIGQTQATAVRGERVATAPSSGNNKRANVLMHKDANHILFQRNK